ncbi:hypothetical protein K8R47_03300 [archaeon]|nr:hypothetical protein [archaeon]
MNKKASIQIQETILVLFIFMIILSMALVIFYNVQKSSVNDLKLELQQQNLYNTLITLSKSPDAQYTQLNTEKNAIDTLKLLDFNKQVPRTTIIVKQIHPDEEDEICTKNNYPNCNTYQLTTFSSDNFENNFILSIPISLYFPLEDKYKVGEIRATWHY